MKTNAYKLFFKHKILFILHSFCLTQNLHATESLQLSTPGVLTVCSESGQIPYEMKNKNGEWYGFDVEMMKAFSQSIKVKMVFKDIAWDGIIPSLIAGKCDVIASSMVATEERKKTINFSDTVLEDGVLALVLKTNDRVKIIHNDHQDYDKSSLKIAVPQGTIPDFVTQKTMKHATILKYKTNAEAFAAMLTKKTDVFISDKSYVLMMNLLNPSKFHLFKANLFKEDVAVAFRKKDTALKEAFNQFLKDWKKSGDFDKTYDYFFNSLEWKI